jgi:hypothetical protein
VTSVAFPSPQKHGFDERGSLGSHRKGEKMKKKSDAYLKVVEWSDEN